MDSHKHLLNVGLTSSLLYLASLVCVGQLEHEEWAQNKKGSPFFTAFAFDREKREEFSIMVNSARNRRQVSSEGGLRCLRNHSTWLKSLS